MQTHESKTDTFECPECTKDFQNKGYLKSHMKSLEIETESLNWIQCNTSKKKLLHVSYDKL